MPRRSWSSITDRRGAGRDERGQALVVFTIWLFLLIVMVAFAFDVGQTLLDRRDQQDAADAAALAGARFLTTAGCKANSTNAGCPEAVAAAVNVATANGFQNGVNGATVGVRIPPGPTSIFSNFPGYIEVNIGTNRPSLVRGRFLPNAWKVASMGVAANTSGVAAPYSLIALNPTACPSVRVAGQGSIVTGSNIQINSSCTGAGQDAFQTAGQAFVDITSPTGTINVVGEWSGAGGQANVDPVPVQGAPWQPDPLGQLPAPPLPGAPAAIQLLLGSQSIPAACPGGSAPATAAAPKLCQFTSSYAGSRWRLYPGYYPGGLKFQAGEFYFEPGIYYLGGGGLDSNGNSASLWSVDAGGTAPAGNTLAGGILLYNTEDATYHDQCAGIGTFPAGVTAVDACLGGIKLNGSSATIHIRAIQTGDYAGIIIFQDRNLSLQPITTPITSRTADVQINGAASTLNVVGTVYAPKALVQANGNNGTASTVQIIADSFTITGNNANLNAAYDGNSFFQQGGVGLVE